MTTDPRSDAIRAMGEVIAAQAAHIENLERGYWTRTTRDRMERAQEELEELTGAPIGTAAPGTCTFGLDLKPEGAWTCALPAGHELPGEQHHHLIHTGHTGHTGNTVPCSAVLWDDRCTRSGGHDGDHYFPDFEPRGGMIEDCNAARQALHQDTADAGLDPKANMFDKGGYLPHGLTQVTNTTGEDIPLTTPCQGRNVSTQERCILGAGHLWPHRWPDGGTSGPDSPADDRCPATNLGAGWGQCTRTKGHIGAHQYESKTE